MPLCYGAATRVPLVYIGVEARFQYGMGWGQVSLVIASYQLARAAANAAMPLGHVVGHGAGAAAGLVGYLLQGASSGRVHLFWASVVAVALSEVIVPMQHYVKEEVGPLGATRLREALRLQYASSVVGTSVGFLGAALLYHWGSGIRGVARLGAALEAAELAALAAFLALAAARPDSSLSASLASAAAGSGRPGSTTQQPLVQPLVQRMAGAGGGDGSAAACARPPLPSASANLRALNARAEPLLAVPAEEGEALELIRLASAMQMDLSLAPAATPASKGGLAVAAAAPLPPPPLAWISYIFVATYAVQALCIGCVLSTAPLLFYSVYGLRLSWVGLLFGAGEAVGALLLLALVPASRQQRLRRVFRAPLNLMAVLWLLGCTALLYCVGSLRVAMGATVAIMALNDLATSLCAEFQGGSVHEQHYMRVNVAGNLARRVGNTCTAVLGPMLFSVAPWLPFAAFGTATLAWVGVLAAAMRARAGEVASAHFAAAAAGGRSLPPRHSGLRYYQRVRSFVSSELAMREQQQQQQRPRQLGGGGKKAL